MMMRVAMIVVAVIAWLIAYSIIGMVHVIRRTALGQVIIATALWALFLAIILRVN